MLNWEYDILGPVVRTGPNELSFIGADAWEDIYGVKVGGFYTIPKKGNKSLTDQDFALERRPLLPKRSGLARSCLTQRWPDRCQYGAS